jgi:hypothetical protein
LRVDERMSGVAGGRARVSGHSRGSSRTTPIVTRLLRRPLCHVNVAPDTTLPSNRHEPEVVIRGSAGATLDPGRKG